MLETMKKWDFEWKKINLFTVFQQWKHNVVSSCTFKIKAQKMLQKWCKSSLLLIPTNFIYWSGKIQPNILHLEALFCNMDNCCSQKVKIHMTLLNTRIVPTKKPQLILKGSADRFFMEWSTIAKYNGTCLCLTDKTSSQKLICLCCITKSTLSRGQMSQRRWTHNADVCLSHFIR